jgi:titin
MPTGNRIEGNYIGTNTAGTAELGNDEHGVTLSNAKDNVVGGTTPGARNVISGSNFHGVLVSGPGGNRIEGNYIGTNASGTAELGNGEDGVLIHGTPNNVVGGTADGAGNLISGNTDGVRLITAGARGNKIEGNHIGTNATRTAELGNHGYGVKIGGAPNNVVGGTATGAGNLISGNDLTGVYVFDAGALGNRILSNSIHSNGGLGIDLDRDPPNSNDGVTTNDSGDGDTGPNNLQNFPVLSSASTTTIKGKLNSTPNTTFTVQFFSNPSGTDEGKKFIGQKNVFTDGSGNTSFTFKKKVGKGQNITATATNNDVTGGTSEYSAARKVIRR